MFVHVCCVLQLKLLHSICYGDFYFKGEGQVTFELNWDPQNITDGHSYEFTIVKLGSYT